MKSRAALDWLNFLLADVKDGLGPFLAVYLLSSQHWDPARIGVVMTIAGIATVVARTPVGALVDWTRWKRGLVVTAAAVIAVGALALSFFPDFWLVALAQAAIGGAGAVFPPAIAAISLGMVGPHAFTRRVARNEALNHAGLAVNAVVAGVAGWMVAPGAVLWLIAALAAASIWAALRIEPTSIDHAVARGCDEPHRGRPSPLRGLLTCKPLLIFTAVITLFHFANAAMLPLLGEKLAQSNRGSETLFVAACIIVAQIVMIPTAVLVGRKADIWGRKPLFLTGFAVLPIRGLLYTLTQNPYALVSIQLLDGIGAGIFGALFFVVIADLTKGTGRYNLVLGASAAIWGLGAALSNSVAGFIVDQAGYSAAFVSLAACALFAFLLFWIAMPETSGWPTLRDSTPESAANAPRRGGKASAPAVG
jgi:MFS family permease